ncbi:MAG: hypothetical protein QMD46_04235 [Methanomicrobiales archaeon]|nr:hypothetical protein [Methanomicrobiales archaeon]MDI6876519.1 hypothetical protein [Methanomicrobiales archaeon]
MKMLMRAGTILAMVLLVAVAFVGVASAGDSVCTPSDGCKCTVKGAKYGYCEAGTCCSRETCTGLEGWKIYIDLNKNGMWDENEPYDITNETGNYLIQFDCTQDSVEYHIREVQQNGWVLTFPLLPNYGYHAAYLCCGCNPDPCGDACHKSIWRSFCNEPLGCTRTPGYWKTHSVYGPAPYDSTWASIGEDTLFYESGQSFYEVLWTEPRGNAYYILSFQFIAAQLNVLSGAHLPPAVEDAMEDAAVLFNTYTPSQIAQLKGNSAVRQRFIELADLINDYNEGELGVPHCT